MDKDVITDVSTDGLSDDLECEAIRKKGMISTLRTLADGIESGQITIYMTGLVGTMQDRHGNRHPSGSFTYVFSGEYTRPRYVAGTVVDLDKVGE